MNKSLGVIGGLGYLAGARFINEIGLEVQRRGAKQDLDFPEVILYSFPFTGTNETGITHPELVVDQLRWVLNKLDALSCDVVIMACNSVHAWFSELKDSFSGELLNMVELACDAVKDHPVVGVLSSETTRQHGLYLHALSRRRIRPIQTTDEQQVELNEAIRRVMDGTAYQTEFADVQEIIEQMTKLGAEKILIACTEVPFLITPQENIVDAGQVVINHALDFLAK